MDNSTLDTVTTPRDNFCIERTLSGRGFSSIGGSDEVGRGPLAGPVVAACVMLPVDCDTRSLQDSKKLSHRKRLELFAYLEEIDARIGVGIVSEKTIDRINILQSSLLAMRLSVDDLAAKHTPPDYILVDGKFEIPIAIAQQALIKGESKSASIAAASIVAKVTRDALMVDLDRQYPQYNFKQHKGYPTKEHRRAIALHGPCPVHRKSFRGVKDFVR